MNKFINTFNPTIKTSQQKYLEVRDSKTNPSWSIMDIKTHYKPTKTFQHTHFTFCHPPGITVWFNQPRPPRQNFGTNFEISQSQVEI